MKNVKTILALALALALALSLAACGGSGQKNVEGDWKATMKEEGMEITYILTLKEGVFEMRYEAAVFDLAEPLNGTYTLEGDTLTLTAEGEGEEPLVVTVKEDDGRLFFDITDEEQSMRFEKVG